VEFEFLQDGLRLLGIVPEIGLRGERFEALGVGAVLGQVKDTPRRGLRVLSVRATAE